MRPDVEEVRNFYRSQLGAVARRLLAHRIRMLWPDVRGQTVLGLGYAAPFMRPFLQEAERVIAVMPEDQGAMHWPAEGPSRTILASETELPLRDASVHKVLAVHSLEMAGSPRPLLREIWRVLAPEGKLLLIVPNRRGLWARFDHTPFGHGRPYSRGQLERLLASAMFAPAGWSPALFMPPMSWRLVLNTAVGFERARLLCLAAFLRGPRGRGGEASLRADRRARQGSRRETAACQCHCAAGKGHGPLADRSAGRPARAPHPRFVSRKTACSPMMFCQESGRPLPICVP